MIHNKDCLEFLKDTKDNSFDLCVSSPPYNIGLGYNKYNDDRDDYIQWMNDVWKEVCRVLKDDGHLFLNIAYTKNSPFSAYKIAENVPWELQNNIIWGKSIEIDGRVRGYSTPTSSKRYLQNGWEHLFHFTKDGDTEIDLKWSGVPYNEEYNNAARNLKRSGRDWRPTTNCWHITYQSKATKEITKEIAGDKKHPAIFPTKLVEKCLKVSGLKKGIVFDPFMGTGTTACVAKEYGLEYVGCEIDKDYWQFSNERLTRIL